MQALPLGDLSTTPWSFSPLWFVFMALAIPGLVWLALAWRRALLECPNRVRRSGVKEMRRLLKRLQRSDVTPQPAHLHAWLRASARIWDVRTSAPSMGEVSQAAYALTGDESVSTRWRELWQSTERALYSANADAAPGWLERASSAVAAVDMPKRERMFPNRLRDWLPPKPDHDVTLHPAPNAQPLLHWQQAGAVLEPGAQHTSRGLQLSKDTKGAALSLAVALFVFTFLPSPATDADVPWSSPPTAATPSETQYSEGTNEHGPANTQSLEQSEARSSKTPSFETSSNEYGEAVRSGTPPTELTSPAAVSEPLPPEVQQAAQAALDTNWNDWAAHHNLAAYQTQQGNLNLAIAHATAAFIQHPAAATTRDTLLAALGETETIDPNLRRLLRGSWYERAPTLLSAATWQRLALIASLIAAAGLILMVIALYAPRDSKPTSPGRLSRVPPSWLGRGAFATSAVLLAVTITSWNAYGELNHPTAAILVQNANMSPVPTDLVPMEETSPLAAGTVVITRRTFLSWLKISNGPDASGWIRDTVVMPLYATH